ncbi:MAG: lysozyme inhibitor LprI family protein [Gemmobacter sp.]
MRLIPLLPLMLAAQPAAAQDPRFSPRAALECLGANAGSPEARACIGLSASDCMETTPMGGTTIGMGFCLDAELSLWDGRLNAAYRDLMAQNRARDAETRTYGGNAPPMADALRGMQRAWIAFRDARCDYERSQWGGGTGGGPATYACLMQMTGEQALYLEATLQAAAAQ